MSFEKKTPLLKAEGKRAFAASVIQRDVQIEKISTASTTIYLDSVLSELMDQTPPRYKPPRSGWPGSPDCDRKFTKSME
jgi:hypothetical protein